MVFTLMNKDIPVLKSVMDNFTFTKVIEICNINCAPLSIYNAFNNISISTLKSLNDWFKNSRSIPSWRKDLRVLLQNLNVKYTEELLLKAYGLSLSDCYWIINESDNLSWEDINFFSNDFEYLGYLEATFSQNISNLSLASPNNTTDGMLSKAWIIESGKRRLMKGTYTNSMQEPINEYITSIICERLNIPHVKYEINIYNEKLVSICDNVLNGHEEYCTAYDIFKSKKKIIV